MFSYFIIIDKNKKGNLSFSDLLPERTFTHGFNFNVIPENERWTLFIKLETVKMFIHDCLIKRERKILDWKKILISEYNEIRWIEKKCNNLHLLTPIFLSSFLFYSVALETNACVLISCLMKINNILFLCFSVVCIEIYFISKDKRIALVW